MLELPFIQDVRVAAKPSPITGQILSAEIVLKPASGDVDSAIKSHLAALPRASRPVSLRYVDAIAMGATGKKSRAL